MEERRLSAIAVPLLAWYDRNKRDLPWRHTRDPYRIWVSEIMLQQTRVAAVLPYYRQWMEALPTAEALAAVPEERLMKLWQGLGYYSRARNLQRAAQVIVNELDSCFPDTYEGLLRLPGVGDYTAGAIASIAFGQPVPAVDGNVLRVAARAANMDGDIMDPKVRRTFREVMESAMPPRHPGAFNQALMDLGATVCLPNGAPLCEKCPAAALCRAFQEGRTGELPVKGAKRPRRVEERTVYLLFHGDSVALRRRPDRGLLAGLWEYPNEPADGTLWLQRWGLSAPLARAGTGKHIFTHKEWHMAGYIVKVEEPLGRETDDIIFVEREERKKNYPIPSAFRAYMKYM